MNGSAKCKYVIRTWILRLHTVRRGSTTVLRWAMRAVRGMRARHVDAVGPRVTWLRRITQVRVVMIETDHVRVRGVARVRVLIVLRH